MFRVVLGITCLAAALGDSGCKSVDDPTGIALSIVWLTTDNRADSFRISITVGDGAPQERTVAIRNAPQSSGNTVNILLPATDGGKTVYLAATAVLADTPIAAGAASVILVEGAITSAEIVLRACLAAAGPYCDGDTLVTCRVDADETIRTVCPYGCDELNALCNACVPSSVDCRDAVLVLCDAEGNELLSESCTELDTACRTGQCSTDGCTASPRPAGSYCLDAEHAVLCDGQGATAQTTCTFGCNDQRGECNECRVDSAPANTRSCQPDLGLLCNAEVTCDQSGHITSKHCCPSDRCTCDGASCLEDVCTSAPEIQTSGHVAGDTCSASDSIPGDCYPGGEACVSVARGGSPDAMFRLTLPEGSSATRFYNVVIDPTASQNPTGARLSSICGSESMQIPFASGCNPAPTTASAELACGQAPDAEPLVLCGLPAGAYFGTAEAAAGTCGPYDLDIQISEATLATPAQAGNISRGGVFVVNTCGLGNTASFPNTQSVSGCSSTADCVSNVCPVCSSQAATDCRVAATASLCSYSGARGREAVFYMALPVDSGVDISTKGSNFDTVLYIMEAGPTPSSPPGATRICNDECWPASRASHIQTSLPAGLYYVYVDGATADECGDAKLTVQISPSSTCPNLRCESPTENCATCPLDCQCNDCGDGSTEADSGEQCDDGNTISNDGCSSACQIEPGYVCSGAPSHCVVHCGEGNVDVLLGEECDDGGTAPSDGCSSTCRVETGFVCSGSPSLCIPGVRLAACPQAVIPDDSSAGVTSTVIVASADAFIIGGVSVDVALTHTYVGDLVITLSKASGPSVILHNQSGGGKNNIIGNYETTLPIDKPGSFNVLFGLSSAGTWTLNAADQASSDTGTLKCWALNLYRATECNNGTCEPGGETCGSCPADCPCPHCGDGILQQREGEQCDDGNHTASDGCSASCVIESNYTCTAEPSVCFPKECPNVAIPDNDLTGITRDLTVTASCRIASASVFVDVTHQDISELVVELIQPPRDGVDQDPIRLHDLSDYGDQSLYGIYETTLEVDGPGNLSSLEGRDTGGVWRLRVSDEYSALTGTLNCWGVSFTCQ